MNTGDANERSLKDRVYVLDDCEDWRSVAPDDYRDRLVITSQGFFMVRREDLMAYARPATRLDLKRICGHSSRTGSPKGHVQLPRRLPFALALTATSFFRHVWLLYKREDVLLLYFLLDQERYELHHPKIRWADGGGVRYDMPATPANAVRLGSLHSHGNLGAHHSSEDWRDDVQSPGVHIVIGHVDQMTPSVICSVSDGRACYPVPVADVFEDIEWPSFPKEWLIAASKPGIA